ncbi:type III secretion protein [Occultella glacieicola]|uniref:Type III secretion protein n=1 Tax=Occultella glacieicola TaxID=2518684 RepID=A0ABY2EBW0_9MICO|nr:flagellar biosynthetic protein FliR [Occultella glacieicola]TDE98652.1 type III secretion protein [Occultella glacieicola]
MGFQLDQGWLEAVLLAAVRVTAFLFIAPPFAHRGVPARIKAMLAVGLALAVSPVVTSGYVSLELPDFLLTLVSQLFIGAGLGTLVAVVFAAVQSAGSLIDLFGGFQMAQAFDPGLQVSVSPFGRLYHFAAIVLLFASDGYQLILAGLVRTFTALPLGAAWPSADPAAALTTGLSEMFVAALQIAGPMIVVLFLADAGLGLLTRVAPALNAFALGFPVKILLTVSLAATAFLALPRIVASLTDQVTDILVGVG